jgi:hypothetical protein
LFYLCEKSQPTISTTITITSHIKKELIILKKKKTHHLVGGIPAPLKNMKVSWDHYPQLLGKIVNSGSKPPIRINTYIHQWIIVDI